MNINVCACSAVTVMARNFRRWRSRWNDTRVVGIRCVRCVVSGGHRQSSKLVKKKEMTPTDFVRHEAAASAVVAVSSSRSD
jgi:hypothetical protein